MDFLQLEYFCAVAKEGNITRAAEQLHISQPSLSQTMAKLEADLQVELLTRIPRGIRLTEAGKRFLQYAQVALQNRKEIALELKDLEKEPSGEIIVMSNALSYVIAKLFCDFKILYPHVTIRIIPRDSHPGGSQNGLLRSVDLFVTTNSATLYGAESLVLLSEPLLAAIPVGHRLQNRESILLEELANDDFIVFQEGELRQITESYCQIAGFTPKVVLECTNTNTLFSLVTTGMGVGLFPNSWKNLYNDGRISLIPIERPECIRTVRLVWGRNRYLSNATQFFRDYIIENIEKQMEENFC